MFRVMVVDDEPFVRTAIRSLCDWGSHGYRVDLEARSGEQALELLQRNPDVAIMLLDIVMPGMDGIQLLRRMNSEGFQPSVIVLSAHDGYRLVREAFKAGAEDYILKSDLESEALLRLFDAASSRIRRAQEEISADRQEVLSEEMSIAREELLRGLLRGRNITDLPVRLAVFDLPQDEPTQLGLLWIDDAEIFQRGPDATPSNSFRRALLNTVRQIIERIGCGEVVSLSEDEIAVVYFARPGEETDDPLGEALEEIRTNVKSYFDVELSTQASHVVDRVELLSSEYRRLQSYRSSASRVVVRARRHIRESYERQGLSLASLSRTLGVSHNYLSSVFRTETGKTITEYITEVRIDAAKRLLLMSDLKVYEVSEKVGYRSVEHFCRVFRKAIGRSPGAFARHPLPPEGP